MLNNACKHAILAFAVSSALATPAMADRLTVYIAFQEDHAVEAVRQFTRDTGIDVDMIRMSAGEILARIRAESNNPQADAWYGGPADTFVAAGNEGLLAPYQSPNADVINDSFKDSDHLWTGIYIGTLGFASNRDFLSANGIEAPRTWEDLLDPVLESEVLMAHPGSSGTAYTALYTTLLVNGGEDEGFEYLKQLHPQVQQYTTSGSAPGRMVGMSEAGVAVLFAHDIIKFQEEGFTNLELTIPEDGTGFEIGAVAMINGAPNPDVAKAFIDWTLTAEAQELGQTIGSYQNLTNPNAQEPPQAVRLEDVNLLDYDAFEAGGQRNRLLQRWGDEIYN